MIKKLIKFNNFLFLLKLVSFLNKFISLQEVRTKKEKRVFTKIWYNIWLQEGYATSKESIIEKKRRYENFSRDFLIKFLNFSIGTIRIIHNNNEIGLPITNNFKLQKNFKNEKIIELSLFSIIRFFRFFHIISLITMKKIYQLLKKENIPDFLAAIDQKLLLFLKEKVGIPLHQVGQEKIYEGSLTYPIYLNLKEAEEFGKQKNYQLYKFFII